MKIEILKAGDRFDLFHSSNLFSAGGKRVAETLAEFVAYYEKAKGGSSPETLRISKKQAKSLSWSATAKKEGSRPEPRALNLFYNDIPVVII